MSLWRQKSAITRAVAGQLCPEDEARLRAHLRGCLECRRYYDTLTTHERILAGDPHTTPAQAERELARLMGALQPEKPLESPAGWLRFALAAGVAAAVVFGFVSWRQPVPSEAVVWRGGPEAVETSSKLELWVVTAPQDGGELRRDIAFPTDAIGRVRHDEWVAFAKKGGAELRGIVLLNEKGDAMVLKPGQSVALDVGKWRVFGVGADADRGALTAAAHKAGLEGSSLELPGPQVSGVLIVKE